MWFNLIFSIINGLFVIDNPTRWLNAMACGFCFSVFIGCLINRSK